MVIIKSLGNYEFHINQKKSRVKIFILDKFKFVETKLSNFALYKNTTVV